MLNGLFSPDLYTFEKLRYIIFFHLSIIKSAQNIDGKAKVDLAFCSGTVT